MPFGSQVSGVVFRDRWRTADDLNIVWENDRDPHCRVYDMGGRLLRDLGLGFCRFLEDGSALFMTHESLSLRRPGGPTVWSVSPGGEHDLAISADESQVFILGDGGARGFQLRDGDKFFEFATPNPDSVQALGPSSAARDGIFSPGNLLITSGHASEVFVVDSRGKMPWRHQFLSRQAFNNKLTAQEGPHFSRLLDNGHLLVLLNRNSYEYNDTVFSSLVEMAPSSGEVLWRYIANPAPRFRTETWGAVEETPDHHFLVTASTAGSAFEITRDGRLVWEWFNPEKEDMGISRRVYRVMRVPRARLKGWL